MKLAVLEQEIQRDCEIDKANLDRESLNIPMLHAKYYRYFMEEFKILKLLDREYKALKKTRTDYYMGRAPDEEYMREPLGIRILRTDVDLYLDADSALSELKVKLDVQQAKVDMLEAFVRNLSFRNNTIKNAIDFIRFKNGA